MYGDIRVDNVRRTKRWVGVPTFNVNNIPNDKTLGLPTFTNLLGYSAIKPSALPS